MKPQSSKPLLTVALALAGAIGASAQYPFESSRSPKPWDLDQRPETRSRPTDSWNLDEGAADPWKLDQPAPGPRGLSQGPMIQLPVGPPGASQGPAVQRPGGPAAAPMDPRDMMQRPAGMSPDEGMALMGRWGKENEAGFADLKAALLAGNKLRVVRLVRLPLAVTERDPGGEVRSREELSASAVLGRFDEVFPPAMRQAMATAQAGGFTKGNKSMMAGVTYTDARGDTVDVDFVFTGKLVSMGRTRRAAGR